MAEIVATTDVGRHNADLGISAARIYSSGSWKKQRITVLRPADRMISAKVALSHQVLVFPPNQPVHWAQTDGMEVGHAYSHVIEAILGHPELTQWEYFLTIEADNMPPNDGVIKLLARMETHPEFACISGLYWTKGEGGVPQIWGDVTDPQPNMRPQMPKAGELVECCGTGMGFAIWRASMFKDPNLRKPWFKTIASKEGMGTQDLYFWSDARKYGYRCAVDCDVLVGHYDPRTDIVW